MDRNAHIARTPDGETNVNRLRMPEWSVVKLCLKAGSKTSKAYRPVGAPKLKTPDEGGSNDFNFAPSNDEVSILYEVHDPCGVVDGGTLELYTRFQDKALWKADLKKLGKDWWTHGKHTIKWDGRVVKVEAEQKATAKDGGFEHDLTKIDPDKETDKKEFPDGYTNLKHTPYKLKLTLKSEGENIAGNPTVAWTYYHVMVEKLELELGDEEAVPAKVVDDARHKQNKAVHKQIKDAGGVPKEGDKQKVKLVSDLYKTASSQMSDNTLYTQYETLWADGPNIPIYAKVKLRDAAGREVEAPKAIGKVKFLWDWESKTQAVGTGKHSDSFVNNAQDYLQAKTKPKGQICHKDRGGKRGTGANPVFPKQAGYDPKDALDAGKFPFEVEAVKEKRTWAAFSYAWTDKKLAGKTGVVFQPARHAGDSWVISCYVAYDHKDKDKLKLEVDDDAPLKVPEKIKICSGSFEIWRKTHLRKYLKKCSVGVPSLSIATIAGCYTDSFMEIEDVSVGAETVPTATWNTGVTNAISGYNAVEKLFIDTSVDQHTSGAKGVYFRTRAQFETEWKKKKIKDDLVSGGVTAAKATNIANAAGTAVSAGAAETAAKTQAQTEGYNATDRATIGTIAKNAWNYVYTYMNNPAKNLDTNSKYAKHLEGRATTILKAVFNGQFDAGDGVHIFQTERSHNLTHHQTTRMTLGQAHDFGNASLKKCGFLLMSKSNDVTCGIDKVSAHEIGHHYYLPHPTDTGEMQDYKAHDKIVPSKCLMSYNFTLPMDLCGLCQLRLRGWDKSKLDPDGTKNKKT